MLLAVSKCDNYYIKMTFISIEKRVPLVRFKPAIFILSPVTVSNFSTEGHLSILIRTTAGSNVNKKGKGRREKIQNGLLTGNRMFKRSL